MNRLWRLGVIALLLTVGALAASATPAVATTNPASTLVTADCVGNPSAPGCPPLLPVARWSAATGQLHGRLSANPLNDIAEKIQRNGTYPVLISMGNSMWSGATSVASAAIQMNILDSAGEAADKAAATLGESLISSGVLAFMAVIALMVPLWRAARGQGRAPWMSFLKTAGTVALFSVMVTGAAQSTTTGGKFEPGFMSPGWFVVTTNTVISTVASAPAAALTMSDTGAGKQYDPTSTGPLSCAQYVNTLKAEYAETSDVNSVEGSVPLVMSGMWEATGLEVWATSQFGGNNPYGDYSYCRLLEQFAGVPPSVQAATTEKSTSDPVKDTTNTNSLAWQTAENDQQDRTMVAWGMCRPDGTGGWKLADGWGNAHPADHPTAELIADCGYWYTQNAAFIGGGANQFKDGQSSLNWDDQGMIISKSGGEQVQNYLLTLQGHTGGGVTSSLALVYSYVFSSLIIMVVFGMISLSIIVAKVSALVMMVATVFVLLMGLWPGNTGRSNTVGKYFGQYVGMSVFVFGIQLVFAFLTLITSMLISAGNSMFGGDTMVTMLWTGFAPVVAVVIIHMVFTKFLNVPSPFSMKGAHQWGAAASGGAFGGVVGAGLMNRLQNRSGRVLMQGGNKAGRAVMSKVTGGRVGGRPGRGTPRAGALVAGGPTKSVTGAGVAAAGRRKTWSASGASNHGVSGPLSPYATREERDAFRAQERQVVTEAVEDRGFLDTRSGRYAMGLETRLRGVANEFRDRPIVRPLQAVAKTAGAGALVVASGGMAVPVMAAVWGVNHVKRVRAARTGAIRDFGTRREAELASQQMQDNATGRGNSPASCMNGETVVVGSPAAARSTARETSPTRTTRATSRAAAITAAAPLPGAGSPGPNVPAPQASLRARSRRRWGR